MNRELAQIENISGGPRRSRWFGKGVSACLAGLEPGVAPRKLPVNWGKVVGLGTALVVAALVWTVVGIVISRFLK